MDEIYFARETLSVVESLLQIGLRTQWMYRMMLSRLYYAAHHLGRLLLRNIGIDAHQWRGEVHRRVINEMTYFFAVRPAKRQSSGEAVVHSIVFAKKYKN